MAPIRLDKLLVSQGCGTRTEMQRAIRGGRVTVDGEVWRDPARKLDPSAHAVLWGDKAVTFKQHLYLMMNKPAGWLCVSRDPKAPTVMDLLPPPWRRPGLFPAGRLDKDTVGFVLITDDGEFAHRLLAPRHEIVKRYRARIDAPIDEAAVAAFAAGIVLADGTRCRPSLLRTLEEGDRPLVEIHISEGRYHQIKRMFGAIGRQVVWLQRFAMGGVTLDDTLSEGETRELTPDELARIWRDEE